MPLLYLRQRNIAAVVIWPDDDIKDDVLAKLKQQLAPLYQYEDLRDLDNHDPPNCGIFLYHSNLTDLPPPWKPRCRRTIDLKLDVDPSQSGRRG